jgi:transcriptional regulator with XRE-family HTH domain
MNPDRLRIIRLARGLSMEELAHAMGGLVSKQAISKYEKGLDTPRPTVLRALARALGVGAMTLVTPASLEVQFLGWRKRSRMGKREQETLQALVTRRLEERFSLQQRVMPSARVGIETQTKSIATAEEAEKAAAELRREWDLGHSPIGDLTAVLEERLIHVLLVEAPDTFDGIPASGTGVDGSLSLAAIALRRGMPGDRQRLSAAHELGHLALKPSKNIDEEKAAYRFASSLLAPARSLKTDTGERRTYISIPELLALKRKYGLSIQALLRRLLDLGIITATYYTQWCREIARRGWRVQEPCPLPSEEPQWLERTVWRALGEGLIDARMAEGLLGRPVPAASTDEDHWRTMFAKLPPALRRDWLRREAGQLKQHYETDAEVHEWENINP